MIKLDIIKKIKRSGISYLQKMILCLTVLVGIFSLNVYAIDNNVGHTKRVISVVYDDSYSMTRSAASPDKQDDLYAKYALENVIAFMNENDDLNVVRMSNKDNYDLYGVNGKADKEKSISKVELFASNANDTPFAAVETAIEFLKEKKEQYGNDDSIEYWLLVLTDGDFSGSPKDANEYFNNLRLDMSGVKYESVWVFIGNSIKKTFSESLKSVQGTSVIYSDNSEAICDAVYDACSIIYGRPTIKQANFVASNDNKTIKINTEFPVSKVMVYEQDQNVILQDVSVNGKSYKNFESINVKKQGSPAITSNITQLAGNQILPAGELTFNFSDSLNTSENKFMIMLDYALELQLGVISSNGDIEKIPTSTYGDGDTISFVSRIISLYDGKEVDVSKYTQNITGTYAYSGQTKNMTYDGSSRNFKFMDSVKIGSNPFSSLVSLKGQFRLKSNVVDIYVPPVAKYEVVLNNDDVKVSKKISDYENVGNKTISIKGLKNNEEEELALSFKNIPKGIQIRINDIIVKNNKITLRFRGNQEFPFELLRNKDYTSSEIEQIKIDANFKRKEANDNLINKELSFNLVPVVRELSLTSKTVEGVNIDNLDSDNAFNKNLYEIIPMVDGKNISMEELKKSKIEFKTKPSKIKSKIKYKIEEIDGQNGFYIHLKPALNWFTRGENFSFDINMKTSFGEDIVSSNHSIYIKNNILGAVLKLLLIIFAIWYIIGLKNKPRLDDKKYKIIVTENGDEKANEKLRKNGGISSLIPYVAENGYAYDLSIKASKSPHSIIVLKKSLKDGMTYEGLDVSLNKDLELAEDTPLIFKEGRNKTIYTYTDVVTKELEDDGEKVRSGRRRRRG